MVLTVIFGSMEAILGQGASKLGLISSESFLASSCWAFFPPIFPARIHALMNFWSSADRSAMGTQ